MKNNDPSWNRLARLAAGAPPDEAPLPFGFATRVVAAWKTAPAEVMSAALAGLTWRGVAVATGILCACVALSYSALTGIFNGEAPLFGSWIGGALGL